MQDEQKVDSERVFEGRVVSVRKDNVLLADLFALFGVKGYFSPDTIAIAAMATQIYFDPIIVIEIIAIQTRCPFIIKNHDIQIAIIIQIGHSRAEARRMEIQPPLFIYIIKG